MSYPNIVDDIDRHEFLRREAELNRFFDSCFQRHIPIGERNYDPDWLIEGFLPSDYHTIISSLSTAKATRS